MPPRSRFGKQPANRLPNIAPREEQETVPSDPSTSTAMAPEATRTRLPPRSRNGCWTCRMRKVKCDEGRPSCQQCTRRGHTCDYSAKLAFKNETPKIVEKYTGSGARSPAWDSSYDLFAAEMGSATTQDDLPPFTALSNEESWERKAEHTPPGTYYVVANPASFSDVEEYRYSEDDSEQMSRASSSRQDLKPRTHSENIPLDSATIILGTFEEAQRKQSQVPPKASPSREGSEESDPVVLSPVPSHGFANLTLSPTSTGPQDYTALDSRLRLLLQHQYRTLVRWHILQNLSLLPDHSAQIEDALERKAKRYPPLQHAVFALSALSLSQRGHAYSVVALQQYQAALESLKHEQDLASDGSFLTHFVLLLYEVAGTEPWWTYHMNLLKKIIHERRRRLETEDATEAFPYVIWWTCLVDLNALLSGIGKGEVILSLIHNNHVPTAAEMREAPPFLSSSFVFDGDRNMLTTAWVLQREVGIATARIGEIALQIRNAYFQNLRSGSVPTQQVREMQRHADRAMELLRSTWNTNLAPALATAVEADMLGDEAYACFTAARLIYYNCVIFVHTCMLPSQWDVLWYDRTNTANDAARTALLIVEETVHQRRLERRFCILPLLFAGTILTGQDEQRRIRDLLGVFNQTTLGCNTWTSINLLDRIRERRADLDSHEAVLDLMSMNIETGLQLIHFGL